MEPAYMNTHNQRMIAQQHSHLSRSDAQIYHMFEGLILAGAGILFIFTKGEAFGFTSYADDFFFFLISFGLVFGGLIRIVTSYYQEYFAKYAIITKSFLLIVEGAYLFMVLYQKQYEYIAFVAGLFVVNLIRLVMKIARSTKGETSFIRFSFFLLTLVVVSGAVMALVPDSFPFQQGMVIGFLLENRFVFTVAWFATFVPALLFTMSPFGNKSKISALFFALIGLIAFLVATQRVISSEVVLAYTSYLIGAFVLFISWWTGSQSEVSLKKSFILLLCLVWISVATLIGLFAIRAVQAQSKSDKAERMQANLVIIEENIEDMFEKNALVSRSVIQKNQVLDIINSEDTEAAINVSRQVYDGGSYLRGVNFVNREGKALGNYPRNSLVIGTDFSSREYFLSTRDSLKGQVGVFFVNILGNPNIAQTEPFFENNDFAGLLAMSIDLEKYSMDVKSIIENHSVFMAIDSGNIVVVDSKDRSNIGSEGNVSSISTNGEYISKDSIMVHRSLSRPDWELYLTSNTVDALREVSYLAIFLTVLLLVNGFISLVAAVSVAVKQSNGK